MTQIICDYSSIDHYMDDAKNNPTKLYPESCINCGSTDFVLNGFYPRKSENRGKDIQIKNGTLEIRRCKCKGVCAGSYSILPSIIPPLRWYLWCMQQLVLMLCIAGVSIHQIAKQATVARSTVRRWISWGKCKWAMFCNELMLDLPYLSGITSCSQFYKRIFEKWKLSDVMCKLHHLGIVVPG